MGKIREIKFDENLLTFRFIKDGVLEEEKKLKLGYEFIAKTYYKDDYPTKVEIEKALNYVEYGLSDDKALVCNDEVLACKNPVLVEIMKDYNKTELSKEEVEEVFDKYADCATGEPAHLLNIDFTLEKFSLVLVVRAIIYYLGFSKLKLD